MRHDERYDIPVKIHYRSEENPDSVEGTLINVSRTGFGIELPCLEDVGAEAEARLILSGREYCLKGVITRSEIKTGSTCEVGMQFSHASRRSSSKMLDQLLDVKQYQTDVREIEGRQLSLDEAARQWDQERRREKR
ncbi:MAG: PilZ domain-containing protein [Fibrobacterota bacterium]